MPAPSGRARSTDVGSGHAPAAADNPGSDTDGDLPSVLLLGGLGMVGINLLKYLVDFRLASFIRVVDKRVPGICDLSLAFLAALAAPGVEFVQADVSVAQHAERVFAMPSPPPTPPGRPQTSPLSSSAFTIVINAAAETGYGYFPSVYEQNVLGVRQRCAATAAAAMIASGGAGGCECYMDVSTAQVYRCSDNPKRPSREKDGVVEPWTMPARYHAEAEEFLRSPVCAALPWVVVRLPVVYGPGDKRGLMPRIACASTYARAGARMELLWGPGLRLHTVHAQDAASAMWHIACTGKPREVYNICDDSDTSQGSLNVLLEQMFGIRTGFHSSVMSRIAVAHLEELAEEANADHMEEWRNMLKESGIPISVVTPYLDPELLANHPICIDNAKLKALGFTLSCPVVTRELLEDSVEYWRAQHLFPTKEVVSGGTAHKASGQ